MIGDGGEVDGTLTAPSVNADRGDAGQEGPYTGTAERILLRCLGGTGGALHGDRGEGPAWEGPGAAWEGAHFLV